MIQFARSPVLLTCMAPKIVKWTCPLSRKLHHSRQGVEVKKREKNDQLTHESWRRTHHWQTTRNRESRSPSPFQH